MGSAPSMLDLVRLGTPRLLPPGGEDLYRHLAVLTELRAGLELLDVGCGPGASLEYFVREWNVHGTGVDADSQLLARAEAHARDDGVGGDLSFQEASPDDLPFRDETFDVVVGELGWGPDVDPSLAVREMVRVTRPGGRIALIQLVWTGAVAEERKQVLASHLGVQPLMTVELRRILLEAGVTDLHAEDWTQRGSGFRRGGKDPFPDFAELFSLPEKLGILRRAWKRWGWKGVRTVFRRETEIHRLLTRERVLGLSLLLGVKSGRGPGNGAGALSRNGRQAGEKDMGGGSSPRRSDGDVQSAGLPLFGEGEEESSP